MNSNPCQRSGQTRKSGFWAAARCIRMTTVIGPETAISLYMTHKRVELQRCPRNRKWSGSGAGAGRGNTKTGKVGSSRGKRGQTGHQAHTPTTSGDRRCSLLWLLACSALANTDGRRGGRGVGRRKCTRGGIGRARAGRGTRWLGNGLWAMGGAYLTGLVGCSP